MLREDIHYFGLGSPSIYVGYHRRLAVALADSLLVVDPSYRHKPNTLSPLSPDQPPKNALQRLYPS